MLQGGLSAKYVADEASIYELEILIKHLYLSSKESWEQTRMITYAIAQTNSRKKIKPEDIMTFPWDDKGLEKEESNTIVTEEEMERMRAKAKRMEQYLKTTKHGS